MTKHRPPLSIDAALARIAGQLPGGWAAMAEATGRCQSLVRAWGDPDRREEIPVRDAIALDLVFQAEGGTGAPVHEAYTHQLELAQVSRFADAIQLGRHAIDVIRESGEAHAALVAAAQPGATPADRRKAEREIGEALEVLKRALPLLARQDGTHPSTGPPPGS